MPTRVERRALAEMHRREMRETIDRSLLYAAAPEMLEVLKEAHEALSVIYARSRAASPGAAAVAENAQQAIRAAIAKAEGREP